MESSRPLRLDEPVAAPVRGGDGPCAWWHFGLEPLCGELILVNFARTRARRAFKFAEHRSGVHELLLVRRGKYRARVERSDVAVPTGSALLVAPDALHEDTLEAGAHTYGFQFVWHPLGRKHWLGESLFERGRTRAVRVLPNDFPWSRLERWNPGQTMREPFADLRMRLDLLEILYELLGGFQPGLLKLPGSGAGGADDDFRRRLEAVFAAALSRAPSVGELSAAMGMKAARFAHDCTRIMGASPRKAHLLYRLTRARARLVAEPCPVQQVAEDFGFVSPFHFSRVFRTAFGYPPSRLRQDTTRGRR
jgi:AraC-like DNA-binding protein